MCHGISRSVHWGLDVAELPVSAGTGEAMRAGAWAAATRTVTLPLQHGLSSANTGWYRCNTAVCSCDTDCAGAARAVPLQHSCSVPLQHGLCSCNTGCAAATRTVPVQHGLCRCNTAVQYRCSTDCAAATRAEPLQHGLCRCNTGCAAATRTVQLQHGLCSCSTGCQLQHA